MLRLFPFLVPALLGLAVGAATAQPSGVPLMNPSITAAPPARPATPAPATGFKTITWEALVPADWDPFAEFKGIDLASMQDGDPRANELLKRMREIWDRAPVNTALVGQRVRIPGFVVPLEDTKDGIKEFLLVPYFGACIHSPPPPSNQIIHVLPKTAVKGIRSMDAVWITGTLSNTQTDSYMGASSWRVDAVGVVPYEMPKGR
ncbi:hypothetical protein D621_06525 [beta proteobacterium AAP51]|nr:hypothetical protein D621_06525 [beta proteobacterium AAP51]